MFTIQKNASLKRVGTFGIGGKVRFLVTAKSPEDLLEAVLWAKEKKVRYRVIAGGSNIVFPDAGLDYALIRYCGGKITTGTCYALLHFPHDRGKNVTMSKCMVVDAGVMLGDVVERSIALGWKGLETLSGIPGTVGGAVYGNAGAYGRSISEVVVGVEVFEKSKITWLTRRQCAFRYRHSVLKEKPYHILRVALRFEKGHTKALKKKSRAIIAIRERKYKPGLRCPGSFFKNVLVKDVSRKSLALVDPEKIIEGKIPTGWLLEQVNAKGMHVGGIEIAGFHGNLFINRGGGTAADVKKLARVLKGKVKRKFGIMLEEEVRYF